MKSIFLIVSFFFSYSLFSQTTYTETIRFLEKNNDYSERHLCYGSTALVKVEYYKYNNNGYAVIYFKKSNSDIYGNPYIYCNISKDIWDRFRNYGVYNSWGEGFNLYIKEHQCDLKINNSNNNGYSTQNNQSDSYLYDVMKAKQAKYDANLERVKKYLMDISNKIDIIENIDLRKNIDYRFISEVMEVALNGSYDLSIDSVYNNLISFIYNTTTKIKEEEIKKEGVKQQEEKRKQEVNTIKVNPFLNSFLGKHFVSKIEEYVKNNDDWILIKTENKSSEIILYYDKIEFKRADNDYFSYRELNYNSKSWFEGFYLFNSSFGDTYIDYYFNKIVFF